MFPMQLKVTHVDGGIVVKYLKPSTYFRSETEELDSEQTRAFQPNLGPPDKNHLTPLQYQLHLGIVTSEETFAVGLTTTFCLGK